MTILEDSHVFPYNIITILGNGHALLVGIECPATMEQHTSPSVDTNARQQNAMRTSPDSDGIPNPGIQSVQTVQVHESWAANIINMI